MLGCLEVSEEGDGNKSKSPPRPKEIVGGVVGFFPRFRMLWVVGDLFSASNS